jgi:hypothetical protein
MYFFDDPLPIETGDVLRITCVYDTSDDAQSVSFGEGTDDEMCLVIFFLAAR